MNKPSVAVISSNKDLLRFFELELISMDYMVSAYIADSSVPDNYDFVIVDTNTINNTNNMREIYAGRVLTVSSDIMLSQVDIEMNTLPWPVSVERIREACCRMMQNQDVITRAVAGASTAISNKVYVLDANAHVVVVDNHRIKLSQTEFLILEMLCSANGEVVLREDIMNILDADEGNISDVYIYHLRKKLETPIGKKLIFTERKRGYRTSLVLTK